MAIKITTSNNASRRLKAIMRNSDSVLRHTAGDLSKTGKKFVVKDLRAKLDRPTPFTLRGVHASRVRKDENGWRSSVFIFDAQAEYLRDNIHGGTRKSSSQSLPAPFSSTKKDRYGNVSRATMKKVFAIKTKRGKKIMAYRRGKKLNMIGVFKKRIHYKKRIHFYQQQERTMKLFDRILTRNYNKYIK